MKQFKQLFMSAVLVLLAINLSFGQWTNATETVHSGDARLDNGTPFLRLNATGTIGTTSTSGLEFKSNQATETRLWYNHLNNALFYGSNLTESSAIFMIDRDRPSVNSTSDGYINLGITSGAHLTTDGNEIQAKNGASNSDLYLNFWGSQTRINTGNNIGDIQMGSGNDLYVDNSAGRVGIGTSTPLAGLHINTGGLRLDGAGDFTFYNAGTRLGSMDVGTTNIELDGVGSVGLDAAGVNGAVYFNTNDGSRRMTIDNEGNVGIGTSAPTKAIEIVGQLKLTNTLANNVAKQSTMLMDHYSGGSIDFAYFKAQSSSTQNSVNFGGGAGANYAATSLSFFTANNTTTTNGSVRMRIRNDGRSIFQTNNSTGSTYPTDHNVWGTAGKPGGGNWSGISDRRLKKGIREYTDGLDQIMRIEPVFYKYDENEVNGTHGSEYVGIVAQDMQKIAPYMVSEVEWANEEHRSPYKTVLTYDGTAIPYMLINATQSQQKTIEELEEVNANQAAELNAQAAQIETNKADIAELKALIAKLVTDKTVTTTAKDIQTKNAEINGTLVEASLKQNQPNPFNENTIISYNIPEEATTASMNIFNTTGHLVKSIKLNHTGEGQINLKANNLTAGNYVYQLTVDGQKIDSKTMILVK